MIEKKYCKDYESNVSFLDVVVEGNRIKYEDPSQSFYKIYVWQQEMINEMLKKFDDVILEIYYVEFGYTREIRFTQPIDIYISQAVSSQCYDCIKRPKCKTYQNSISTDMVMNAVSDEQIYNMYLLAGAKKSAMEGIETNLRKVLDKKIEASGNALHLDKINLNLFIEQIYRDTFPVQVAIDNKLLNDKNCRINIGEFRKNVKGTEYEKQIKKVPHQRKLNIGNIPELM
jgi:hypothetical protein